MTMKALTIDPVMRLATAILLQKNDATLLAPLKHQKSFKSNFMALNLAITQVKLLGWCFFYIPDPSRVGFSLYMTY